MTSPSLPEIRSALLADVPAGQVASVWDPRDRDNARAGAKLAFGEPVHSYLQLRHGRRDRFAGFRFPGRGPGAVRYARDFAARRKPARASATMNRLYVVETHPPSPEPLADHRLADEAERGGRFARALAREAGSAVDARRHRPNADGCRRRSRKDLQAHQGTSLVIAGDTQPPVVHALAHAINESWATRQDGDLHRAAGRQCRRSHLAALKQLIGRDDTRARWRR